MRDLSETHADITRPRRRRHSSSLISRREERRVDFITGRAALHAAAERHRTLILFYRERFYRRFRRSITARGLAARRHAGAFDHEEGVTSIFIDADAPD